MPKIGTILTAGVVLMGALGAPGIVGATSTGVGVVGLQENVYNEFFKAMRLDPNSGFLRLNLTTPEGWKVARLVVARPGEDRYRLMTELDAAAMGVLDGEAEGLELLEQENMEMIAARPMFDDWVGFNFSDYMNGGLKFLERNPADVIYVGLMLRDEKTGREEKQYYKLDYRSCAHEEAILTGERIMCDVVHEAGKSRFVPEAVDDLSEPPTWEEELVMLAKNTVKEYFDELEALEAVKAGGGEIETEQIEILKAKGEEMDFAKFPEMAEIRAIKVDYSTRVVALKTMETETDQGTTTPSIPNDSEVQSTTKPQSGAGVQSISQGNVQDTAESQSEVKSQSVLKVQSVPVDLAGNAAKDDAQMEWASELNVESGDGQTDDQEGVAVPKLGGSWLKRYGLALLIAGASAIGVVGWFLIGIFSKKHKRSEK